MLTNILTQDFTDFAKIAKTPQKGIDTLLDFYVQSISNNESKLVIDYAERLLANKTPHIPDPRIYMRQNLLSLVQDSYALGISDGLDALADVQFSYEKTIADFAQDPNDRLQRDINKLQRDIQASQNIVRQTKTLNNYTKTLQGLQNQAQTLGNTQATQTLNGLANNLQSLKTGNTVRSAVSTINKQLQKGQTIQQTAQNTVQQQINAGGTPNTQDYLIKRAIEEKLKYLQNRKDALGQAPPVVLDEDKDFFKWYNQKRLVPIANRYQQGLLDKNKEAQNIVTDYTEKINKGSITDAAKGDYQQRIINKILNIEDKVVTKGRPIKRVQRVVATELAIAYNIGRLKTYLKAGIQYVTISTSMYSANPCNYCIDTEQRSLEQPIKISSLLKNAYKNNGFKNKSAYEAGQNVPIEQRYLSNHPYCMCIYLPHPKQDDTEKETEGVYTDPNSWKFILGAGLGVSLAYLAFALTTGKKINIPTTIPVNLPVRARQALPDIISDIQPVAIPVRAIPAGVQNAMPDLISIVNLPVEDQERFVEIIKNPLLSQPQKQEKVGDLYRTLFPQSTLSKTVVPPTTIDVIGNTLLQNEAVRRLYIQTKSQKIASTYNRNIAPLLNRVQELQQRVTAATTKADTNAITNSLRNVNKTFVTSQLQTIQSTKDLVLEALTKTKPRDIEYREELLATLDTLTSMESDLLQQRQRLGEIQERVQDIAASMPTKRVLKTYRDIQIKQEIARALADIDSVNVASATERYNDLLALLIELPAGESNKYLKQVQNLKTKIQKASITELKHRRLAFFNRKHQ